MSTSEVRYPWGMPFLEFWTLHVLKFCLTALWMSFFNAHFQTLRGRVDLLVGIQFGLWSSTCFWRFYWSHCGKALMQFMLSMFLTSSLKHCVTSCTRMSSFLRWWISLCVFLTFSHSHFPESGDVGVDRLNMIKGIPQNLYWHLRCFWKGILNDGRMLCLCKFIVVPTST